MLASIGGFLTGLPVVGTVVTLSSKAVCYVAMIPVEVITSAQEGVKSALSTLGLPCA